MNGSNTSPRSFSDDQLRAALGDVGGPARIDYLPDLVARAGRIRQRPEWTFLGGRLSPDPGVARHGVPRAAVVFASVLLLVALLAAGLVHVGAQRTQPERLLDLPTTPGAWERVLIDTPSVSGRVASVAVSPRGLLAVVGGDEPARLAVSTDGRTWTLVPEDQHPTLSNDRGFGMPSLVSTDRGFLMLQLNEVWLSENGYDWQRLASATTDPDLDPSGPDIAVAGGPGLVAVGDDKAWYSVDGSDWSLAAVPQLPAEILARSGSGRLIGVTGAGNDLVAWGLAEAPLADNGDEHLVTPLLWASHDGRTWATVADPEMDSVTAVTGGPHGFVATGQAGSEPAVWLSADGEAWERVGDDAFTSPDRLDLNAAAATSAGYVVIGTDGQCVWYPCAAQDIVIWTSRDGRSWSRVPTADLLDVAQAYRAIAWGSSFLIGGSSGGKPAIWSSGSEQSRSSAAATATATATPSSQPASSPTPAPSSAGSIQDIWAFEPLAPIEPGMYSVDPDLDPATPLRVVYEVPAPGWSMWVGGAKFSDAGHVGVSITNVVNLVSDGCRNHTWADPSVGQSVDDLAAALADLAPFRVTSPPTDVTAYGYSGKHLEWTVPDLPVEGAGDNQRFTGCVGGKLKSWVAPFDTAELGDAFYGYTGPGYREEFWILDVEGSRLMIAAERSLGSPPEDLAELRTILGSIRIEP